MLRRSIGILLMLFFIPALSGCAIFSHKPPPAFTAPAARVTMAEFAGSALSGPGAVSIDPTAAAQAWGVSARIVAVEVLPHSAALSPIGPQARLVIGQDSATLFAPSARLASTTRAGPLSAGDALESFLGAAGRWKNLQQLHGGVAPGSTIAFGIFLPEGAAVNASLARRRLTIAIDRAPGQDGYELTIMSDDLVLPAMNRGQEKVIIPRALPDGKDRLAISAPMRFPDSQVAGLVIELTVDAKAADAQTIAAMTRDIDAASVTAAARLKQTPPSPADAGIAAALDSVAAGAPQRGTLAYLASETSANLTATVVRVADDQALELLVGEIRARLPNLPTRDRATVAWMLDRATIKAIASIKQEDSPRTLPPILGALSAYAGEAGRQLDVLQSLAGQSASSEDLFARLTAEQYIALEDSSPALRVRAYDWLAQRGIAPEGFDPLGKPRDRRAALEKFAEAATRPAADVSRK